MNVNRNYYKNCCSSRQFEKFLQERYSRFDLYLSIILHYTIISKLQLIIDNFFCNPAKKIFFANCNPDYNSPDYN